LHPSYGNQYGVEKDPLAHVLMKQSIVSAYSVIETLGFKINASQQEPSKLEDGNWNPKVFNDLNGRLSSGGINIDETLTWMQRGPSTRIHKKKAPPKGKYVSWARGTVRDSSIPIQDAINYVSFLRSKIGAHASHTLVKGITMIDVSNAQHTARMLLMSALRYW
jgi:hypothetical protein